MDRRSIRRTAVQGQAGARRTAAWSQESRPPAPTAELGECLMSPANYLPTNFLWRIEGRGGVITLNRPERKNPLTFESSAEVPGLFRRLGRQPAVKAIVVTGAGGNFFFRGELHAIR